MLELLAARQDAALGAVGLDDFGHRHAEALVDDDDLAARHQAVVDVDVDRFADLAVELDDGAAAELEELAHLHGGAAKHGGDLHRHVVDRLEVLGVHQALAVAAAGALAFELGQLEVFLVVHVTVSWGAAVPGCGVGSLPSALSALTARATPVSLSGPARSGWVSGAAMPGAWAASRAWGVAASGSRRVNTGSAGVTTPRWRASPPGASKLKSKRNFSARAMAAANTPARRRPCCRR